MSSPILRIALPGYRADTDTNPDHFALVSDEDWVLIKEKERGTITVGASDNEPIDHNLGYVPLVFVQGQLFGDAWVTIHGDSSELSAYYDVSTSQVIIHNNYASAKNFRYYIFYDQMIAPGLITKSMRYLVSGEDPGIHPILAIGRSGVNALEDRDPNHFIYHSDYNTFKILETGLYTLTIPHDTYSVDYTIAHGKQYRPFVRARLREGTLNEVISPGNISGSPGSYIYFHSAGADYTNLIFRISNYDPSNDIEVHIRYFLLEVPQ